MRFSSPRTASRLRRPISESTTATFLPCIARAVPRFAVVVVLPTPPLPDVIVITRLFIHALFLFSWCTTIDPGLNNDLPLFDGGNLRLGLHIRAFWWSREQVGDT